MNNTTPTDAVAMTSAYARLWIECPQPLTRRLADTMVPFQGSTLPTSAQRHTGPAAGIGSKAPMARAIAPTYLDVRPFRTGRPPV